MTTKEDYKTFLSQVRASTGVQSLTPDESGLVTVNVDGNYNLNLQFVEASGKVLCFIEVTTLPHDAPKAVYRDLLVGCLFGKDTAGGYFAVEPESETVGKDPPALRHLVRAHPPRPRRRHRKRPRRPCRNAAPPHDPRLKRV